MVTAGATANTKGMSLELIPTKEKVVHLVIQGVHTFTPENTRGEGAMNRAVAQFCREQQRAGGTAANNRADKA